MTTRDLTRTTSATRGIPGLRVVERGGDAERRALGESSLVVDALPGAGGAGFDAAPHAALAVELAYGAELAPRVARARAAGREAFDGLGLLVFQGRRSLARWLGREIPLEPLARAVGWPR